MPSKDIDLHPERVSPVAPSPTANGPVVPARSGRMESGFWLLSAAPSLHQTRTDWAEKGAAWLRPGLVFAAVSVPAALMHAAVGKQSPQECAAQLAEALQGGTSLFYSPAGFGPDGAYTALLPPGVGDEWGLPGTVAHPQQALLLVPSPDRCEPAEDGPWWVVGADAPIMVCLPDRLAALVDLGRERLRHSDGGQDA